MDQICEIKQTFELGLKRERRKKEKTDVKHLTLSFWQRLDGTVAGIRPIFYKVDECCRGFHSASVNSGYLYKA